MKAKSKIHTQWMDVTYQPKIVIDISLVTTNNETYTLNDSNGIHPFVDLSFAMRQGTEANEDDEEEEDEDSFKDYETDENDDSYYIFFFFGLIVMD